MRIWLISLMLVLVFSSSSWAESLDDSFSVKYLTYKTQRDKKTKQEVILPVYEVTYSFKQGESAVVAYMHLGEKPEKGKGSFYLWRPGQTGGYVVWNPFYRGVTERKGQYMLFPSVNFVEFFALSYSDTKGYQFKKIGQFTRTELQQLGK